MFSWNSSSLPSLDFTRAYAGAVIHGKLARRETWWRWSPTYNAIYAVSFVTVTAANRRSTLWAPPTGTTPTWSKERGMEYWDDQILCILISLSASIRRPCYRLSMRPGSAFRVYQHKNFGASWLFVERMRLYLLKAVWLPESPYILIQGLPEHW